MLLHHEALSRNFSPPRASHIPLRFPRRISLFLLASIIVFIIAPECVRAQTGPEPDEPDIVRVRTDLVSVPLFVMDRSGRRIFGLKLEDFGVQVDGHNLKPEYLASGTEHVALVFALDASGSAREIVRRQSDAALALFSRFGPKSRVAVWHFSAAPRLVADFTSEAERARAAFNITAVPNERTAIFDAAAAAVRSFDRSGSDPSERRILILISDGLDTASTAKAADVIAGARERGVSIYVIHLPLFAPRDGRLQARPATKGFRALAEQTGGRYFMVGDARSALAPSGQMELEPVFKAIEDDLRGQYVLGFYPLEATRDGRFHTLSIRLTARGNQRLRVQQLREGYTLKQ